jgi:hypothetical protein
MSDDATKIEIPTAPDGSSGVVIEACTLNGQPAVRLLVVVDGRANRVTLDPKSMLGVACLIGDICEKQGRKLRELAEIRSPNIVEMAN